MVGGVSITGVSITGVSITGVSITGVSITDGSSFVIPNTEPMISNSSAPEGISMVKVLLSVVVCIYLEIVSSPSAKTKNESSSPS